MDAGVGGELPEFRNNDAGYLKWLEWHPVALVLNVRRETDPGYVLLHRASCGAVSSSKVRDDG